MYNGLNSNSARVILAFSVPTYILLFFAYGYGYDLTLGYG